VEGGADGRYGAGVAEVTEVEGGAGTREQDRTREDTCRAKATAPKPKAMPVDLRASPAPASVFVSALFIARATPTGRDVAATPYPNTSLSWETTTYDTPQNWPGQTFVTSEKKETERRAPHDAEHTTPTAMSSNAKHATNTTKEGDTATHVERALNEMLLKGADCAKCGGSACKKCACKLVYYCGKECQRGDWADHKARCKKARATAQQSSPQEAIPGLPDHLVVAHVLRSEYFDDPADLARLPAVSRAMRDTVAATGLRFKELGEDEAVELGCLSAVQRMQRQGRLSSRELLCHAAALSGQLEELKLLRENDYPWDESTCFGAAFGGHLEVLRWVRANGCPWNETTS
jgi:hypothetical protein